MTFFCVLAPFCFADSDFYPLAELGQKFEEAIEGVTTGASAEQGGNFWLIEAEKSGGSSLRKFLRGDSISNSLYEYCFCKFQIGVLKTEIGEDISTSDVYGIQFRCHL